MMPMPQYRLALADLDGTVIEEDFYGIAGMGVPDGGDITWTRTLNAAGAIAFSCGATHPFVTQANFPVGQREIHLYRRADIDAEEVKIWAGRLWRADMQSKVSVRFAGQGFFSSLEHREIDDDLLFNNEDDLDVAWSLIDFTQSKTGGDLGITRGSATGGVPRFVAYCLDQRETVADAIRSLAEADDGFDFEIDADKVWRTWSPQRGTDLAFTLDTASNVVDLANVTWDAIDLANEVTWISGGGNCETPVWETALDTDSRAAYGLMQSNITGDERPSQGAAKAADALRISRQPVLQPTVVLDSNIADRVDMPDVSEYAPGDTMTIVADLGYASFNRRFRLATMSVQFRPGGRERVTLSMDGVID